MGFNNLRALVTGGGSGIGAATAARLRAAGARVIVADANPVVRAGYTALVSMGTFIDAADIAETIAFLASPAARFISGQALGVDGHTETLSTVATR